MPTNGIRKLNNTQVETLSPLLTGSRQPRASYRNFLRLSYLKSASGIYIPRLCRLNEITCIKNHTYIDIVICIFSAPDNLWRKNSHYVSRINIFNHPYVRCELGVKVTTTDI